LVGETGYRSRRHGADALDFNRENRMNRNIATIGIKNQAVTKVPKLGLHAPFISLTAKRTALHKMKVALVSQQLRGGDVLNSDRAVRGIRNDGVAVRVVMGRCQERAYICKN
jgi:hypothetical protein